MWLRTKHRNDELHWTGLVQHRRNLGFLIPSPRPCSNASCGMCWYHRLTLRFKWLLVNLQRIWQYNVCLWDGIIAWAEGWRVEASMFETPMVSWTACYACPPTTWILRRLVGDVDSALVDFGTLHYGNVVGSKGYTENLHLDIELLLGIMAPESFVHHDMWLSSCLRLGFKDQHCAGGDSSCGNYGIVRSNAGGAHKVCNSAPRRHTGPGWLHYR